MAKKVGALCLVIIACMLIFFAGRFGIANLYAIGLEKMQQRWADIGSASEQELENASFLTQRMLRMHSMHPHYNSLAASQAQWLLFSGMPAEDNRQKLLSMANSYYRTSIEQRPFWPNTYIALANIVWQQGDEPDRMFRLMALGKKFGPFEVTIVYSMAEIGLAYWPILTSEQRMKVFNAVIQGMTNYQTRSHMERIVTSPLQIDRGCRLLTLNNLKTKRCGIREN